MHRWLTSIARFFPASAAGQLLTGAAAGICLATPSLQLVLLWGASPTVLLAVWAAVGVGLAAGCGSIGRPFDIRDRRARRLGNAQ